MLRRRQAQTTAAKLRVADYKAAAKKRGSQVRAIVKQASVVDLAFVCDTTGSMQLRRPQEEPVSTAICRKIARGLSLQDCIDMVKDEICGMVDLIKRSNPQCITRLAFVGYADYNDPKPPQLVFTEDPQAFHATLDSVKAGGGGDGAEDVFTGLQDAGRLKWSSGSRVLIHIADYPCHGQEIHDLQSGVDDYTGGDVHRRDATALLRQLAEGCRLDLPLLPPDTAHPKDGPTLSGAAG